MNTSETSQFPLIEEQHQFIRDFHNFSNVHQWVEAVYDWREKRYFSVYSQQDLFFAQIRHLIEFLNCTYNLQIIKKFIHLHRTWSNWNEERYFYTSRTKCVFCAGSNCDFDINKTTCEDCLSPDSGNGIFLYNLFENYFVLCLENSTCFYTSMKTTVKDTLFRDNSAAIYRWTYKGISGMRNILVLCAGKFGSRQNNVQQFHYFKTKGYSKTTSKSSKRRVENAENVSKILSLIWNTWSTIAGG